VDWNLLSDVNSQALAAALSGAAARHAAIADNIANVDTPGFVRSDVDFEEALALALQEARRAPRRAADLIAALSLRPRRDLASPARADGNNVNIDREMAALARNVLRYNAAGEVLAARIRMLRTAIHEGRR
jgi:flagellar basal-body rod protein FlgB